MAIKWKLVNSTYWHITIILSLLISYIDIFFLLPVSVLYRISYFIYSLSFVSRSWYLYYTNSFFFYQRHVVSYLHFISVSPFYQVFHIILCMSMWRSDFYFTYNVQVKYKITIDMLYEIVINCVCVCLVCYRKSTGIF